jgi:transcriptional regulator with XRE-family HTH domain
MSIKKDWGQKIMGYNQSMGRKFTKTRPRLGAHLMALRVNAGLSQEELAGRVGVLQQTIAFWEQSDKPPRSEVLLKLADALGVTTEMLLSEEIPVAIKKKGGPEGRLRKIFEEASSLPRRQQEKIMEFVSAYINQYKQTSGEKI